MGYSARGEGYNSDHRKSVMMTAENQKKAFERVKKNLLTDEAIREKARGGSFGSNGQTEWWYSWTDTVYLQKVAETFIDILEHLGFEVDYAGNRYDGEITSLYYNSKLGQEDLFLKETNGLWEPGSVIDWQGEDGDHWRTNLESGKELQGTVTYE